MAKQVKRKRESLQRVDEETVTEYKAPRLTVEKGARTAGLVSDDDD